MSIYANWLLPNRKQNRLKGFDYSSCNTYFLTVSSKNKQPLFCNIVGAPNILNQLKGYVTKKIGFPIWQKLFYDHIVRDEEDFNIKWEYIENNPASWLEKRNIN